MLASAPSTGLAAILLGAWPLGTTCHVAADGTLASADPTLDGTQLFHLSGPDTAAVISLLQAAYAPPVTGHTPRPSPPDPSPLPPDRPAPRPPRSGQPPIKVAAPAGSAENLASPPVSPDAAPSGSSPVAPAGHSPCRPLMPAPASGSLHPGGPRTTARRRTPSTR